MQLLKDQDIYPINEILENALGNNYTVLDKLVQKITNDNYRLVLQWKYYKDGKAWLCKVSYKKKTVFWLSIWDKYFKTSFFFTEKTKDGVMKLDIDKNIKDSFSKAKATGKLIALIIDVMKEEQMHDVLQIIDYKCNR